MLLYYLILKNWEPFQPKLETELLHINYIIKDTQNLPPPSYFTWKDHRRNDSKIKYFIMWWDNSIFSLVLYLVWFHCKTLFLCHLLFVSRDSWIATHDLRISSQVLYHCATAATWHCKMLQNGCKMFDWWWKKKVNKGKGIAQTSHSHFENFYSVRHWW